MKYVGAHVSAGGGVQNAPVNAAKIGASAFAFFTRNQRQWHARALTQDTARAFKDNCKSCHYSAGQILPHSSYLINLGHPDRPMLEKSRAVFVDEMQRCQQLGLKKLNFHPGSHLRRMAPGDCLERIAESIDLALEASRGVTAVIENTAGQGSNLGYRFEQIADIIARVRHKSRIGVCLDTCHLFAAGYKLQSARDAKETFAEFDRRIGFKYLCGMHLNDSRAGFGSRLDRHANLGQGAIGMAAFRFIMADERFDNIPLILETSDKSLWPEEIARLKALAGK